MLRKKTNGYTRRSGRTPITVNKGSNGIDRRGFLRGSGLAIGGLAAIAATGGSVTQATAQSAATRDAPSRWPLGSPLSANDRTGGCTRWSFSSATSPSLNRSGRTIICGP